MPPTLDLSDYDTIIIGAGHNGLVCAGYLAKAGQRVLVLEASEECGGLAATHEFHEGFRTSVAHYFGHIPRSIIRDLDLAEHGLSANQTSPDLVWLGEDGAQVRLSNNGLSGVSDDEHSRFKKYSRLMNRFARMLAPFWLKTVPPIGNNTLPEILAFAQLGLKMRMLGKDDMREFLRVVTLPMYDLMDEFFSHPGLKAMLSWDALIGSKQAPRTPNNSVLQLLYRMASDTTRGFQVTSLVTALKQSAQGRGVEIRTGSPVACIEVEAKETGLKAVGVQLENGESVAGKTIVSSADPKTTFLKLLGAEFLEIEFTNRIRRIRDRGLVSKLHLALSDLPGFPGLERPDGRLILAPDLETIEWAFDDAKYGDVPAKPVIEVTVPSLHNPNLAPEGRHVLSANIMYTPHEQREGWNESARALLTNHALKVLEGYAPGICDLIMGQELLTPVDLESRFGVSGGHWHHGDFALDQLIMMRPTYGAAQYGTPIPGIYLCGAGAHPGGDLTGIPGHNAAKEILS